MTLHELTGIIVFLYAVANPVGVAPIFLGFARKLTQPQTIKIVVIAALSVAILLTASVMLGEHILHFFNVSLDDFRIAGGLLVLFIAFNMFQAHYGGIMQTLEEKLEAEADVSEIAVTPLAFPLLVGPAEISIMITYTNDIELGYEKAMLVIAAIVTACLVALTLLVAAPINKALGKTGINVATRIMALIVASIGISFIMTGIKNHLPGLAG